MQSSELYLLTGAAGWLGTGLIRALLEGLPDVSGMKNVPENRRLRVLIRPGEDSQTLQEFHERIERVEGEVRDLETCKRFVNGADGAKLIHVGHHVKRVFYLSVRD